MPAPRQFTKMSGEELLLAKMWYEEDDMPPMEIADLLRRDKSTITRHVVKRVEPKRDGRPRRLSSAEVDSLVEFLGKMIKKADRQYDVTVDMLQKEYQI